MNYTHVYTGTRLCGHIAAACVDQGRHSKTTAMEVGFMVMSGLKVERVSLEVRPVNVRGCKCETEGDK